MTPNSAHASAPQLPDVLAQAILKDWREPLLVLDSNLEITFANQRFCELVGRSWKQVDHQPLDPLLGNPQVSKLLEKASQDPANRELQIECRISSQGARTIAIAVEPIGTSPQKAVCVSLVDITDREWGRKALTQKVELAQHAEQVQRDQTSLLTSVMESTGDGIAVLDADGVCVLSNPASEAMLGMKATNISHDDWPSHFGFYLPDMKTLYRAEDLPLAKALRGETSDSVEVFVRNSVRKEGLWISKTARPLNGGQGGAVTSFRDITFAKQAADALAVRSEEVSRSNRELEQFAYVASHDLQEPLRMVSSYVQLLARRYKGKLDSEADEFIGYATDGAKRMQQLINDLLGYSRVGRGRVVDELVDCERVLDQVLCNLEEKIENSHARITHDPLPRIPANEIQTIQLFQNLIENAIKFKSADPPSIHISAQPKDRIWTFSVADNGIGIAAEYKDRVFVIFQRLHSRDAYPGTGIGLAICKKIVEQHSGVIWLEPGPKGGTVVSFSWPRDPKLEGERSHHV